MQFYLGFNDDDEDDDDDGYDYDDDDNDVCFLHVGLCGNLEDLCYGPN